MKKFTWLFALIAPLLLFAQTDTTNVRITNLPAPADSGLWEKFLSSFFGLGTALLVFYLTTRRDKEKEEKKKQAERDSKIVYLKSLLENIVHVSEQLLHQTKELVRQLGEDTIKFYEMEFTSLSDFKRASDALSKEEYYSAFVKKYEGKFDTAIVYQRLLSIMDYLQFQFEQLPDILTRAEKPDSERKNRYKQAVGWTIREIEKFKEDISSLSPGVAKELHSMYKLFDSNLKGDNRNRADLSYYNNHFVLPVLNYLPQTGIDHLLNGGFFRTYNKIIDTLKDSDTLYIEIHESNTILRSDLEEIADLVNKSLTEFKEQAGLLREEKPTPQQSIPTQ